MSQAPRPLRGHSILVIDDDRLAAYRLHRALVIAGARVASGDLATAEPFLGAAALAAVVVGTGLNSTDAARLAPLLAACRAPWVAYGDGVLPAMRPASASVPADSAAMLVAQLEAVCARASH